MMEGKETVLAEAPISLKQPGWHSLSVQRNTIITKDFIETFADEPSYFHSKTKPWDWAR